VKRNWIDVAIFARVLAGALGSLSLPLAFGCERERSFGPERSRDVAVSTASLRAAPSSASAAHSVSATLADKVLTSGSLEESDPERVEGSGAPLSGEPSPTCIRGWSAPPRGSPLRKAALDMMRAGADERFLVDEIRYFVGPEDGDVVERRREVERWYLKARSEAEPERQLRWLVRRAGAGSGVDAVAPYDSQGYGPGTWVRSDAVDPSLADPFQRPCDRAQSDERCMGLPREVLGCLSGT
jgi:hypothetical protein